MPPRILLGPQRRQPSVANALDRLGLRGRVALISAGWQEREGEADELEAHLARPIRDLMLYHREERVRTDDRELDRALAARQAALRDLQAVYRIRLRHALAAAGEVRESAVAPAVRTAGWRSALRAVRRLDREHLRSIARLKTLIEIASEPARRPAVARECAEIEEALDGCTAVLIAGGHVAVLLNRLRLFAAAGWLAGRPLVAWGAGAMALTERVVTFHDRPPQGAGDPEVMEEGLGLVREVVALPDARHRLALEDADRVGAFAARFAPARCVALDDGAWLMPSGRGLGGDVHTLERSGVVRRLEG